MNFAGQEGQLSWGSFQFPSHRVFAGYSLRPRLKSVILQAIAAAMVRPAPQSAWDMFNLFEWFGKADNIKVVSRMRIVLHSSDRALLSFDSTS